MDCDRVFAVLTRGPFPSGGPEDADVQHHLDGCLSCWRLAEALRPAEHLFQESVPAAESRDLPGYWGDATPPAITMARLAERATETAVAAPVRRRAPATEVTAARHRTAGARDLFILGVVFVAVAVLVACAWWLMAIELGPAEGPG